MEMDNKKSTIRKFKNDFIINVPSEGFNPHSQSICKIIKFSSDLHFNKILPYISKLNSKKLPNLFIFIIEIESFKTHNKVLDNMETIKTLLSEFDQNRPVILQISPKNVNESIFYVKEEKSCQYTELNEELNVWGISRCLHSYASEIIGEYEEELINNLIGTKTASISIRFLRSLDFSEEIFLKLLEKCSQIGTKSEFLSILDTPFEGGKLNLEAEKTLSKTFENGSSILKMAIPNPNKDVVNYLISHCSHLIQQLPFDHRIDISTAAFNASEYNVLCDLLEYSDFPFPIDFNAKFIVDDRLSKIKNDRNNFHNLIKNKRELPILENLNLKLLFNSNNQSALLTCIDSKNFMEYYRLKSFGFRAEINEKCEDNESLTKDEKKKLLRLAWQQTKINVNSSISNENISVIFLSAKSLIHNRKIDKQQEGIYRSHIVKWFDELYKIKICKELMDAAAQCEHLKIIFDFESDSVENVDLKNKNALGTTYASSKWIFIGAKFNNEGIRKHIRGVIIHEICHYVMRLVYENNEMPYYKNDKKAFEDFEEIVQFYNNWTKFEMQYEEEDEMSEGTNSDLEGSNDEYGDDVEEDDECGGIISSVYRNYNEEDYHPEIVVRPPQILAEFAEDEIKSKKLQTKYERMFKFFEDFIIPELKRFNLKNRENVRKFNKMVGLLSQIVKDNYNLSRSKIDAAIVNNEASVIISNIPRLFLNDLYSKLDNDNLSDTKNLFITPQSCENDLVFDNFKAILSENDGIRLIIDCTKGIGNKFKELLITKNIICVTSNEHHCTAIQRLFVKKKAIIKCEKISYTFGDLTNDSKVNLLKTEVNFQNKSTLSLYKLLNTKIDPNGEVKIERFYSDIVDEKLLNLLVDKSEIKINSNLGFEKHFEILFRDRKFIKNNSITEISQENFLKDVKNAKNVLISDISGSGKSWALKNLSKTLIECNPEVWVSYIELKCFRDKLDHRKSDADFLKFMLKNVLNNCKNYEQNIFKRLYKTGNVCIVLDGYDEIHEELIEFTQELIKSFKYNASNQLWIASRDDFQTELEDRISFDATYKLAQFSEQDAIELITKTWIIYDLEKNYNFLSQNELKLQIKNYPKLQIYQNHAKNLTKKIFNSNFNQTGIPNVCKLAAEIFNGDKDKSLVYELNVEKIYDEYANKKFQEWTQMRGKPSTEAEKDTFFSIHQYHAIKDMIPALVPFCELIFNNVNWNEEDIISFGFLNKKGNNFLFQHDSLKLYFVVSFIATFFSKIKKEVNKKYPDDVVAKNLEEFFHSSRFNILRSLIDVICNETEELRDTRQELVDKLGPDYENKDILEIVCQTVNKILAIPHDSENVGLVTQLTNNLFGSNRVVKSILDTFPAMKEFAREFDYATQNYIVKNDNFRHSSSNSTTSIKPEFCITNSALSWNLELFNHIFDNFMTSYSKDEQTNMIKQLDINNKSILYNCIEKRKSDKMETLWPHFRRLNTQDEFIKSITQETLPFKYNIFHAAVVYNNNLDFHEKFWNLVFETLQNKNEIKDILLKNDINGNNVVHLLLISCNLDVINYVLDSFKNNLDPENYQKILKSKNSNGNNLLHLTINIGNKKSYLEAIWNCFKNACSIAERIEFINILMEVNDEKSNIFQLAARFSTSNEEFEFMINEVKKIATTSEIKLLLSNQDIFKRNLLQSAVRQNDLSECHESFWSSIEEFFDHSEIKDFIKNHDIDDNNLMHNVVAHNKREIAEITWNKIKIFLDEDSQIEYLRQRGCRKKTIRKISHENRRDYKVVEFVENICSLTFNKHPHGKPESVMTILSDGRIIPKYNQLSEMFTNPDVKGRNLVAISIGGLSKTGKSFLLNYFLRYLYSHYPSVNYPTNSMSNSKSWMDEEDEPLAGFEWNCQQKIAKNSLIIWNDVFLPPVAGDQDPIAIIVIDTQEVENKESKMLDLISLLSSIFILNLNGESLDSTKSELLNTIIKQRPQLLQNCLLLVRDWSIKSKNNIESLNHQSCFFLSHPGKTVASGVFNGYKYDGSWGEMDEDFKDELFGFIEMFFKLENLICKNAKGSNLKCYEFVDYIKEQVEILAKNQISIVENKTEVESVIDLCDEQVHQNLKATEENNKKSKIEENMEMKYKTVVDDDKILNDQSDCLITNLQEAALEDTTGNYEECLLTSFECQSDSKLTREPLRFLSLLSNGQMEINDELRNIIENPDIKDRKIAIISIFGMCRKGKSFLMNYCLRYLYNHYQSLNSIQKVTKNQQNWMEDSNQPLLGFNWGQDAVNSPNGIFFWNDAFLHTIPNSGTKIAIFVVDTQMSQNESSAELKNSEIFTFSSLISSIQIFNLLDNLEEHNIIWLKSAIESAMQTYQNAFNEDSRTGVFQKLVFLIRDWENIAEYPIDNGENYLENKFLLKNFANDNLNSAREQIMSTFQELKCSFLPHPGKAVSTERSKKVKYNGNCADMDTEFKNELQKFIENLLNPEHMTIKKISGKDINGEEFLKIVKLILKSFKINESSRILEMQSPLEEVMSIIVASLVNDYKKLISQKLFGVTDELEFEAAHKNSLIEIYLKYDEKSKIANFENKIKFKNVLTKNIEAIYNDSKEQLDLITKEIEDEIKNVLEKIKKIHEEENNQIKKIENIQKELFNLEKESKCNEYIKITELKLLFEKQRLLRYKSEIELQNRLKNELQCKLKFKQAELIFKIMNFYTN